MEDRSSQWYFLQCIFTTLRLIHKSQIDFGRARQTASRLWMNKCNLINPEVVSDCSPLFIAEPKRRTNMCFRINKHMKQREENSNILSCSAITNPAVDTTTATVYPQYVIETEIICEQIIPILITIENTHFSRSQQPIANLPFMWINLQEWILHNRIRILHNRITCL